MFRRKNDGLEDEALTGESIRTWLIDHLADRIGVPAKDIDTKKSFEAYGLDSRAAVGFSGALEKLVHRRLSPGLLYEYQTVDDLSGFLTEELGLVPHKP